MAVETNAATPQWRIEVQKKKDITAAIIAAKECIYKHNKDLWTDIFADPSKRNTLLSNQDLIRVFANTLKKNRAAHGETMKTIFSKKQKTAYKSLPVWEKNTYLACMAMTLASWKDPRQWGDIEAFVNSYDPSKEWWEDQEKQQHVWPDNYSIVADIYKKNWRSEETICADFALAEYNRMFGDRYIKIRNFGDSWDDTKEEVKAWGTWDMLDKLSWQYSKFFTIKKPDPWTQDVLTHSKPWTMLTLHNPTSAYKYKPWTQDTQVTHVLIKWHDGKRRDWYDRKIREIPSDKMSISGSWSWAQTLTIEGKDFVIHADSRLYVPKLDAMPTYKPTTIGANDPTLYPAWKIPTEISGTYFAQILADRYHLSKSYISQRLLAWGHWLTTKYNPQDLSVDLVIPPKTTISREYSFKAPESQDPDIQWKIKKIRQYAAEANIPESRTENLVAIFLKENAGGNKRSLAKGLYHSLWGNMVWDFARNVFDLYRKPDSFGLFQISHQTLVNSCKLPKPLPAWADKPQQNRYEREKKRIIAYRKTLEKAWSKPIDRDTLLTWPINDKKEVEIEDMLLNNKFSFLVANELQRQTEDIFAQHLRDEYTGHINGDDLALTTLISHNLWIPRTHALIGQQNLFALAQKLGINFDRKNHLKWSGERWDPVVGNQQNPVNFYIDGVWGNESKLLFEEVKKKLCVTCPFEMISIGNKTTESWQIIYTHIRYKDKNYSLTDHAVSSPSWMKALFAKLVIDCDACKGFTYMPWLSVTTLKQRQAEWKTHLHYAGEFLNDFEESPAT